VQETINNAEQTIRQNVLQTLQTSVSQTSISQFKAANPTAYNQILTMFGYMDSNGVIQVNPNAATITDFCGLQSQLSSLVQTLPPSQQNLLINNILGPLSSALKPQVPQILTQILLQNRENLQEIFQANPAVASQFEGLINQYASSGLLSAFGK